jgi:two-component system phosphate regulon sensor histidine kinase PhoR
MFQSKNLSPTKLALFISFVVSVLVALFLYFFTSNLKSTIITFVSIAIVSFSLVYYVIERFIYRKIKLVYKFISQTKATKREAFFTSELLPQKTIEEVNADVAQWAEDRKVEIERLQSNEQFRREFLMNLAHELKTPIFAAQGYIDTLLGGALQDNNVNTLFLQKAEKSIERLSDLVTDLDQISRIESNRLPINKSIFIIQDLIHDVFEELSQKASTKNIKLNIKKGCEQGVEVFADKTRIKQVLVNLVENSINYGRDRGETNAGIYVVDQKEVFIEITDNGMGIQEDQISRVFERFYRTDSARTRNEGGTGLGLAIVKHIVEAHNHSVTCRSTVDVGTSFGFSLDKPQN